MFHKFGMRHGHPAFAWGGYGPGQAEYGWGGAEGAGPEARWQDWNARGPERDEQAGFFGHHGPGRWHGGPGHQLWHQHGHHPFGPAFGLWAMRRGFGGPFGGPGGPGGPRAFGRGDLKYQLLALL